MENNRLRGTITAFFLLIIIIMGIGAQAYSLKQMSSILNPANQIFVDINNKNYTAIWELLSKKSKSTIINSICSVMKKEFNKKCDRKTLADSFKYGKKAAKDYWNAYTRYFNPKIILKESRWNIKYIKTNTAEISIKYKKAPNPFLLKLFKEKNNWKVGLFESLYKHHRVFKPYLNISSP